MIHILIILLGYVSDPYQQWQGTQEGYSNVIMQFLASNDLMPVVLGVSLLIWFTLLVFIIRLDVKLTILEKKYLTDKDS